MRSSLPMLLHVGSIATPLINIPPPNSLKPIVDDDVSYSGEGLSAIR